MSFKSLIIFALVASVGRVLSAPLAGGHLVARKPCHRTWCARSVVDDGYPDLARRLAEFDDPNVTLSGGSPGTPTSISSTYPSSILPVYPSSIPPVDDNFTGGGGVPSLSTSNGNPQATDPAAGNPVTVTVISTVFLNPTDPAASLPILPPVSSSSSVSLPTGVLSSVSLPPAGPFPTVIPSIPAVIELTNTVPGSTVSSDPAGQPTPSPTTPGGIIFLPPN